MPEQGRMTHARRLPRWTCRAAAAALPLVAGLAAVPSANAGDNASPSRAVPLAVGVPMTGVWPGTPDSVSYSNNSIRYLTHWWASPQTLRAGDAMTIAVAASGPGDRAFFCLAPPTDDFGALAALKGPSGCAAHDLDTTVQVPTAENRRFTLTYALASGPGFLVAAGGHYSDRSYTFTVERIVTRVNPGFTVPGRVGRNLSLSAALRYGDNTPVADGVRASLERRVGSRFRRIASGTSSSGSVRLKTRLGRSLRGQRISLRVCAEQPGGSTQRCTATRRVRVR